VLSLAKRDIFSCLDLVRAGQARRPFDSFASLSRSGQALSHVVPRTMTNAGERFERAVSIMTKLRGPGGCPWDREQTFDSIKPYTLEETYEVLEAIDNRDWDELRGELGDLLLQVLFYSQMAQEENRFSIDDVLDRLANKLINRHPHVFGDVTAETSADVLRNWEALKAEEKKKRLEAGGGKSAETSNPDSVLSGVSSAMPALLEAHKLSSRAAHVGFDWPEIGGLFEKLEEETRELKDELRQLPSPCEPVGSASTGEPPVRLPRGAWSLRAGSVPHGPGKLHVPEQSRHRVEQEVGDLFFVLVNIARYLSVDPESALRKTNRKFRRRFQWMEEQLRKKGQQPQEASLELLEELWQESKAQEHLKP
jgi:nucleoside triphosphate diphosphatase